jgi:hypothetical protein
MEPMATEVLPRMNRALGAEDRAKSREIVCENTGEIQGIPLLHRKYIAYILDATDCGGLLGVEP